MSHEPRRKKTDAHLRLIKILKKVRCGPETPDSLALELGVSRRTVFRDLMVLRQEGFIKGFDDVNRSYILNHDFFLPAIHLTLAEALAFHKLCQEASKHDADFSFCSAARSAGLKLVNILPPITRNHVKAMEHLIKYHNVPKHQLGNKSYYFDSVIEALHKREVLRVTYKSPVEPQSFETQLSVYRILFSRRTWYVLAYSTLHHEVRTFHLGRILDLVRTSEKYEIPSQFSHERYFRNAWHMIPEPGPDSHIVLKFSPMVAQNVAEVLWHKTQKVSHQPSGSIIYEVTVSGLNEIFWWILSYGAEVEVISPPRLRKMLRDTIVRMTKSYENDVQ